MAESLSDKLDELADILRGVAEANGVDLVGIHLVAIGEDNEDGMTPITTHVGTILPNNVYADLLTNSAQLAREGDWQHE